MRRSAFLISCAAGFVLALQGCVSPQPVIPPTPAPAPSPPETKSPGAQSPPPDSSRQCKTQIPVANTVFRTLGDGSREWDITFDVATTNKIESRTATGEDGQPHVTVNQLDCLVDQELRKQCPNWRYREPIATDLPDGRLEAYGVCGH